MKSFIKDLETKIKNKVEVDEIEILDNSEKHKNHKNFSKDKLNLSLTIKSQELKNLKRVDAHKKIMKILSNELKTKIHALEIKIK